VDVDSAAIDGGRRLLGQRRVIVDEGRSFCIETTLATRTLLRFIAGAQKVGYRVGLVFLFTPLPNVNELRVKIARKDDSGTRIVDPAGWSLLQERIAAASAT